MNSSRTGMAWTNLYRLLSSAISAAVVLFALYAGGLILFLLLLLATLVGIYEFWNVTRQSKYHPSLPISTLLAVAFLSSAYMDPRFASLGFGIAFIFSVLWLRVGQRPMEYLLADWSLTLVAGFYTGGILYYGILIRNFPNGFGWGLLTLLGTWACDTSAYLIGSKWGRHRFAPLISPNKTWEGAVGGFSCSLLVVLISGYFLGIPFVHTFALGVLIPIAVILGDLTESLIKRSAGVKDSGNLIPGHGGLLDRIDGLLFAILTVFSYCKWILQL